MKLFLTLFILLSMPAIAAESEWSIRWEAAKGEMMCSIPYAPRSLDSIESTLPAGHSEANADIEAGFQPVKSKVEVLGAFEGRQVVSVELEVPRSYYIRYFLVVVEVEAGRFMPIYIHQYAPAGHGHSKPTFNASESGFSVTITSMTHGTTPSVMTFRITSDLKSPPKTEELADRRQALRPQ